MDTYSLYNLMIRMSYYNTNNVKGEKLNKAILNAKSQDDAVMGSVDWLIKIDRGHMMTARRIWWSYRRLYGPILLTSIRRSIKTLIDSGHLSYQWTYGYTLITHVCPVDGIKTTERKIIKV